MNQEMLAKTFNQAPPGNQIKKVILKGLANEKYLLIIERYGVIWPKKLSEGKLLSYTMGSRQLIIRNESDETIEKIMLGNILELKPEKNTYGKSVMRLIIKIN